MKATVFGAGAFAWALLACGDPTPPAPAPAAPTTAAPVTEAAPSTASPAEAKARFDARVSHPLPAQLPKAWHALVKDAGAKVLAARHAVFSRVDGADSRREVHLTLRVFGDDAALDAKMRALLARWPEVTLEIDRVKGAPPRESQYAIDWVRRPADPADAKKCRAPKAVDLPPEAPRWLDRVTNARSTRRRVGAESSISATARDLVLYMRYRNGYAQDEAIGHFAKAAKRAGYTRTDGEALDQTWTHPKGGRLAWSPFNADLNLGCAIAGPVLRLDLRAQVR
ncbi:MAG: hypothetical protein ACI9U2_003841 [Bradymonadia bacterium]